jgi:hypothetical protein
MTLDEAIELGKIRLETPPPTLDEHMKSLRLFSQFDPTEITADDIALEQRLLSSLSDADRAASLARKQNPGRLKLVNLSGEPISLDANHAVVGTAEAAPPSIPSAISTPTQGGLWLAQIQQQLIAEGYGISADGVLGPATRKALSDFQHKYGLPETGTPTTATAAKLREFRAREAARAVESTDFIVLRVENRPSDGNRFRVVDNAGNEIYVGNRRDELIAKVVALQSPEGRSKYLYFDNFSSIQQEQLVAGFHTSADVVAIPQDGAEIPPDLLLRSGLHLLKDQAEIPIEEVDSGARKGWFRALFQGVLGAGRAARDVTLEVYAQKEGGIARIHRWGV